MKATRFKTWIAMLVYGVLMAVAGRLELDVVGSPVPISAQTLMLLYGACLLTPKHVFISISGYLLVGALGLPVFADGTGGYRVLMGPTGGYLLAMLPAAVIYAWWFPKLKFRGLLLLAILVHLFILGCGGARLLAFIPSDRVWSGGIGPFLPGGAIKSVVAALFGILIKRAGLTRL